MVFLTINFKTAQKSEPYKKTFFLTEILETDEKYETIKLKIDGEEVKCSPPLSELKLLNAGDSVEVTIKKGIFGFEHFFSFQSIK